MNELFNLTPVQELEVINKAITFISDIAEDNFCSFTQLDNEGRRCFIGQYGAYEKMGNIIHVCPIKEGGFGIKSEDASKTGFVMSKYLSHDMTYSEFSVMSKINNRNHPDFQQPTEKKRIMAALYEVKKRILLTHPPIEDIINQVYISNNVVNVLHE